MSADRFEAGARVDEVGKGRVGLLMKVGPSLYRATLQVAEPIERQFAAHFGKLARLSVSFDEAEGDLAEQLAGKTAEAARMRELLAATEHVSGTRTIRFEISGSAFTVTGAADREQEIANSAGEWLAERGFTHPKVEERIGKIQYALGVMADVGQQLREVLEEIAKHPEHAVALATRAISGLDAVPEVATCMRECMAATLADQAEEDAPADATEAP